MWVLCKALQESEGVNGSITQAAGHMHGVVMYVCEGVQLKSVEMSGVRAGQVEAHL